MDKETSLKIYDLMLQSRLLEERLIYMFKQNEGFFWIGGPGEEAFNVPLGMLIKKGYGLNYDYLHLHYRSNAVFLALGFDPMDPIRQMKNSALDVHSGGRNFAGHLTSREWNLIPITSPIEVQYVVAIGTGIAQKEYGGDGITIVSGGDAGTAEGDFASCLIWASRPGNELPILLIVTNNRWGISTAYETQHAEEFIAERGKAFGIKTTVINGNDPEESYTALQQAMAYVREERKPFLLEANVSRLYGHSSASGAMFNPKEEDPIKTFETKLINDGLITEKEITQMREHYTETLQQLAERVQKEPQPSADSIYDYTYFQQKGKYW